MAQLLSPADITELLGSLGLRPRRSLGQNFLADPNTARRITRLAGVQEGDRVLEIGPGIGSLTLSLAEVAAEVVAVELDRALLPLLERVLAGVDNVQIRHADAMEVDLAALLAHWSGRWRMVSNLPYNIATPLVMRVLAEVPAVESLFVMVQREVGDRLAARPGSKAYGAVSVKVAYYASATVLGEVPPSVFVPKPKVTSALVRLDRRPAPPIEIDSEERFFALVHAGFAQRRKTLRRSLRCVLGADADRVLADSGVDPGLRGEALDLLDWAQLARAWG